MHMQEGTMPRRPPTKPPEPPQPPPEDLGETRDEKFKRLAEGRTNHILHHTRVLGNLANRNNYSYTDEQVARIFEVIQGSIDDTQALFKRGRKPEFHL
jgi:hypothetical protein